MNIQVAIQTVFILTDDTFSLSSCPTCDENVELDLVVFVAHNMNKCNAISFVHQLVIENISWMGSISVSSSDNFSSV